MTAAVFTEPWHDCSIHTSMHTGKKAALQNKVITFTVIHVFKYTQTQNRAEQLYKKGSDAFCIETWGSSREFIKIGMR